jgi:hypothetical protein
VLIVSAVMRLKVAVTLLVPFIVREAGLVVPVRSPVQPLKA